MNNLSDKEIKDFKRFLEGKENESVEIEASFVLSLMNSNENLMKGLRILSYYLDCGKCVKKDPCQQCGRGGQTYCMSCLASMVLKGVDIEPYLPEYAQHRLEDEDG